MSGPTFGEMLVTAMRRIAAAQMVLVFGSPQDRRAVEGLVDHKLDAEQAERVRAGLDSLSGRLWP